MFSINWNRPPELKWTKQLCPICREPTGPDSQCYKKQVEEITESDFNQDLGSISQNNLQTHKTIEYGGHLTPIFSEQCVFRRFNTFLIEFNYPLSKLLAIAISNCEGVEQFAIETKYRGVLTIGNQFEQKEVKAEVSRIYKEYIFEYRDKALEEGTTDSSDDIN